MLSGKQRSKLQSHEYWRGRLDEVGETETRAEYNRIDAHERRASNLSALEGAISSYRADRPDRDERRAIRTEERAERADARSKVALGIAGLGVLLATVSLLWRVFGG